jgi:tetratricopeptide (TPR) repeat protein
LNNEYIDSFQNNDLRLSLKCINKAIEYSSDNALLYAHKALIEYKELDENKIINLNNIKLEKKDIDDVKLSAVINLYLKALSLNYNDDCFHHNLGWLYLLKGENRKAFQEISESIAIDSNIAIYHISKGLFFEINNQLDSALYEYKIAIKLSPDILDSYFYSGLKSRYYFKADSIVKVAKKELNDDFTLTKSPILCARLAKIYFTTQDTVEAKRLYEITVEVLPNLNRPWYYLAIIDGKYAKHKKTTETYLKRATLLDNSDYLPTLALADFYEQTALSYNTVIEYYKSSIKNWIHLSSEHSLRVKIIYNQNTLKNDLIPIGLLNHCKPKFDIEKACEKVASIYNKEGVKNMADYYLTLAHNSENIVLQNIK